MVATKRRHHSLDDEVEVVYGTAATRPTGGSGGLDVATAVLVRLCVKVLKNVSPRGLTTKDLALALETERPHEPHFKGVTSSVLSSKLNALFRRFHGDGSSYPSPDQLAELPLTRRQSEGQPKRLEYLYTAPSNDSAEASDSEESLESEPLTPQESRESVEESDAKIDHVTPEKVHGAESPEDDLKSPHPSNLHKHQDDESSSEYIVAGSAHEQNGPKSHISETPVEIDTQIPAAKRAKVAVTPATPESSQDEHEVESVAKQQPELTPTPPAPLQTHIHPPKRRLPPKMNLYYDMIGSEAMAAVLTAADDAQAHPCSEPAINAGEKIKLDLDLTSDFECPEAIGLGDLDSLVC